MVIPYLQIRKIKGILKTNPPYFCDYKINRLRCVNKCITFQFRFHLHVPPKCHLPVDVSLQKLSKSPVLNTPTISVGVDTCYSHSKRN